MLNYLNQWMDQLKWQRLRPFETLAETLLQHLEGILNYCCTKVRFGVVEAVNANLRLLINRGRGYKNLRYLLLKAKRMKLAILLALVEFALCAATKPRASRIASFMLRTIARSAVRCDGSHEPDRQGRRRTDTTETKTETTCFWT